MTAVVCPVAKWRTLLIASDGSVFSQHTAKEALRLAKVCSSKLIALSVVKNQSRVRVRLAQDNREGRAGGVASCRMDTKTGRTGRRRLPARGHARRAAVSGYRRCRFTVEGGHNHHRHPRHDGHRKAPHGRRDREGHRPFERSGVGCQGVNVPSYALAAKA